MKNKGTFYPIKWLWGLMFLLPILWFSIGCQTQQQEGRTKLERIEKRLLKSKEAADRIKAAKMLAEGKEFDNIFYESPHAVFMILRASRDSHPDVRAYMATAMSHIRVESTTKAVMRLLDDRIFKVRISALKALATIGNKSTLEAIFLTLSDQDRQIRIAAISTLLQFEGEKVTGEISKLLMDIDPAVRIAAAEALGKRGDPAAIDALEKTAGLKNQRVTQKAREAVLLIKKKTESPPPRAINNQGH